MIPTDYFKINFAGLKYLGFGIFPRPSDMKVNFENDKMLVSANYSKKYFMRATFPLLVMLGTLNLEFLALLETIGDRDETIRCLMFSGVHHIYAAKFIIFFWKGKNLKLLAHILEIQTKQFYQNYDLIRATIIMSDKCLKAAYIYVSMYAFGGSLSALDLDSLFASDSGLGNVTASRAFVLPYNVKVPFPTETPFVFAMGCLMQALLILAFGVMFFTVDLYIFTCMVHTATQFKILQEALRTSDIRCLKKIVSDIKDSKVESLMESHAKELAVEMEKDLLSCINHHQLLLRCCHIIEDTYSFGFLAHLLAGVLSLVLGMGALTADSASNHTKIMVGLYLVAMYPHLGILCWAGNEITVESEGVGSAVLQSRWYLSSKQWRRHAAMLVQMSQRPLHISAGKFVILSLSSYLNSVKAAYSYYTVLSRTKL